MPKPLVSVIDGKDALKELAHTQHHLNLLMQYYPDTTATKDDGGIFSFFSKSINSTANQVEFMSTETNGSWHLTYALPYKEVDVGCNMCSDPIRVGTHPGRYLVMTKYNNTWSTDIEPILICTSFEDGMKREKISKHVISQTKLHIIDLLKKEKMAEYHDIIIPSSIRKLLVFS